MRCRKTLFSPWLFPVLDELISASRSSEIANGFLVNSTYFSGNYSRITHFPQVFKGNFSMVLRRRKTLFPPWLFPVLDGLVLASRSSEIPNGFLVVFAPLLRKLLRNHLNSSRFIRYFTCGFASSQNIVFLMLLGAFR